MCGEGDGEEARGNMIGLSHLNIATAVHAAGRAAQIPFTRFLAFTTGEQQ